MRNLFTLSFLLFVAFAAQAQETTSPETTLVSETVSQNSKQTIFSIFPNPTTDFLNIKLNEATPTATVYILNSAGKKIYTQVIDNTLRTIDVSSLQEGVYVIQVGTTLEKFVKQ